MPNIDNITEVNYEPLWPYHHVYDNLPINNILQRIDMVNTAVDNNTNLLTLAAGTQGTVENRLDVSIADDGKLVSEAVDMALHKIGEHSDSTHTFTADEMQTFIDMGYVGISSTDISCVRMIEPERAKLALIEDGANNLVISLELPSVISATTITTGSLTIASSDSIGWTYVDNKLSPYLNYPITVAHMHYYDATPTTSDYTTYNVPTYTCILDSLRVYVNGIRVGSANVYVPASTGPTSEWTQTRITSQTTSTFTFNRALDPSDIVRIDFDILTA